MILARYPLNYKQAAIIPLLDLGRIQTDINYSDYLIWNSSKAVWRLASFGRHEQGRQDRRGS